MSRILAPVLALGLLCTSCWSYEQRDLVPDELPEQAQTSFVYDRDGGLITELQAGENRIHKDLEEIPEILQQAVVAIEDERFYLHDGWDFRGIVRAARTNVSAGGIQQGGSTITQQLVENSFDEELTECFDDEGEPTQTIWCKVQEINFARQFEDQYSKDFILERYLNTIFFGNNAYGVQAAAQEYFGKDVEQVDTGEAAMIAGLIQRPSGYDPYRYPEDAEDRRRLVLDRMLANEFITEEEHREATDVTVRELVVPQDEERSEFFGAPAYMAHFVEYVKEWFLSNPDLGSTREDRERLLFEGGLEIHTTLDPDLQRAAFDTIYGPGGILPDPDGPDAAATTVDPRTGEIVAMVGGRDFFADNEDARVNLATGKGRQAGSSIKPIALAAYLQEGGSVTDVYRAPSSISLDLGEGPTWNVRGGGSGAEVSLVRATRSSYNTVFAQLMVDVGPQRFVEYANELGVGRDIRTVHAAVLGTEDVNTLEMATVYSTFANDGFRIDPTPVSAVENADGTILYEHVPQEVPVLDPEVAAQLSWVLEGVIAGGTGTEAQLADGRPAAGKTGTAQNFGDAAFSGYTPQYATSVWVGFAEGVIEMAPPNTGIRVYGGTYPAQIWRGIMNAAHAGLPVVEFPEPPPSSTSTTTRAPLPASVEVPELTGIDRGEAAARVDGTSLRLNVVEVESNEFKPNRVIAQSPSAGSQVPGGSTITIEVSVRPDDVIEIPTLSGMLIGDARSILRGLGLNVQGVAEQEPGTPRGASPGLVWQQTPNAGDEVQPGSTVRLKHNPDGTESAPTTAPPSTTTTTAPSSTSPPGSPTTPTPDGSGG